MKIIQIISESKDGNKREVIGRAENLRPRTYHIHKDKNGWKYLQYIENRGQYNERKILGDIES